MPLISILSFVDIIVFCIIITLFIVISTLAKLGSTHLNVLQYLTMGRALTLPIFVVTLVSSWYGNIIGASQIAYNYGIYNFFALGFFWYLSALIFAFYISNKLIKSKALSLPEVVGKIHGKTSEKILTVLMIIKTLPISYILALHLIISGLIGFDKSLSFLIVSLFAIGISLRTSLKSVIIIDLLQFSTIFIGMGFVTYFCLNNLGGWQYLKDNLPSSHFTMAGDNSIPKLILWFLVAFSTTALSPIFHQRCFAAKSPKTAKFGILISIVFWISSDILTTLGGLYARALLGDHHKEYAYLELISEVLPSGLIGYMIAALIITAISALDSHLFASKSLIINYYKNQSISLSKKLYAFISISIVIISVFIAFNLNDDIEKAWLLFESAFIASVMFPVLFSIYKKGVLTSLQFNYIVTLTFPIVIIMDYYYLSNNTTFNLIALGINLGFIFICMTFNYFHHILSDKYKSLEKL